MSNDEAISPRKSDLPGVGHQCHHPKDVHFRVTHGDPQPKDISDVSMIQKTSVMNMYTLG